MTERIPERLPAEWLPEPVAPPSGGDDAPWEQQLQRLMSAAESALAELARTATSPAGALSATAGNPLGAIPSWWAVLAARWRPTLALAGATAALLVVGLQLAPGPVVRPAASPRTFTLTAVAGDGSAAALWQGMGAEADPVLAQVVLHGGSR